MSQPTKKSAPTNDVMAEILVVLVVGGLALVIAGVPVAMAMFWVTLAMILGLRWWITLAAGVVIGAGVGLVMGKGAIQGYLDVMRLVVEALKAGQLQPTVAANWWPWLKTMMPLSLPTSLVFAGVFDAWTEFNSPWWRKRDTGPQGLWGWWKVRSAEAAVASGTADPEDGIALGVAGSRIVSLTDREANQHTLLLGAPGGGKTETLKKVAAGAMRRGKPVILVDLKGDPEVADWAKQTAAKFGRPFKLWTFEGQEQYNILHRGDPSELTDKVIGLHHWSEQHYKEMAATHSQVVFNVFQALGETPTLVSFVDRLYPQALQELIRDDPNVPDALAARVKDYLEDIEADKSILSGIRGLQNRLRRLTESRAAEWLQEAGTDTLDLWKMVQAGGVVVFSLDSMRYGELAAGMAAAILQDLKAVCSEMQKAGGSKTQRAYVIVDEFSALPGDHLLHLLARGRSAGMCCLLSTQELADLSKVSPEFRDQVIGTTANKIIHRQEVPASAETLASLAGTEEAYEETIQIRQDPDGLAAGGATGMGSLRKVDKFVVHPNDLKKLKQGEAYVIKKHPTFLATKVKIVLTKQ